MFLARDKVYYYTITKANQIWGNINDGIIFKHLSDWQGFKNNFAASIELVKYTCIFVFGTQRQI